MRKCHNYHAILHKLYTWFGKNQLRLYLTGAKKISIGGAAPRPPSKYAHPNESSEIALVPGSSIGHPNRLQRIHDQYGPNYEDGVASILSLRLVQRLEWLSQMFWLIVLQGRPNITSTSLLFNPLSFFTFFPLLLSSIWSLQHFRPKVSVEMSLCDYGLSTFRTDTIILTS